MNRSMIWFLFRELTRGPGANDLSAARVRLKPTELDSTRPVLFLSSGTMARPCLIASSVFLNLTFRPLSQIAPLSKSSAPKSNAVVRASAGPNQA